MVDVGSEKSREVVGGVGMRAWLEEG